MVRWDGNAHSTANFVSVAGYGLGPYATLAWRPTCVPRIRGTALLASILIGCGRSRRLSCRARDRLHARRDGSAA